MSEGFWRRVLSRLRPYLGAFLLLAGVIFVIAVISMAVNGALPKWFLPLATVF